MLAVSIERDKMIEALNEHVVPVLRERGFKGSFPHFRRKAATKIHLLTIQFDKHGGGFTIEIAVGPVSGLAGPNGTHHAPTEMTAWHSHPEQRLRLGGTTGKTDHWFRFDSKGIIPFQDPYAKAARAALPYLDRQAEPWWNKTVPH